MTRWLNERFMLAPVILALAIIFFWFQPSLPTVFGFQNDQHAQLCHKDFLHFYRVELIEKDQHGTERKAWSRWYLIDDRKPEDKEEIDWQLSFFRMNHIRVEQF